MGDIKQKNNRVLLHLSLIDGAGPSTVLKLLKHLYLKKYPELLHAGWMELIERQNELDLELLYNYSAADFIRYSGLSDRLALVLAQGLNDKDILNKELELASKHDIKILSFLEADYPEILKQIHNPPTVLYYQGSLFQPMAKRIGIVGSRMASTYAHDVLANLIPGLVAQGWHIVSGGAQGADTIAHEATLTVGGRTIAVLGSGLLQPYPNSNKNLFKRIVETGGTMVSPFPLMMFPDKPNFPARNRIISGLSLGCVVIQAAEKSGALITAHCALEQGRQVFAVPGPIDDDLSAGCHNLIKEGAKLVNNVNDILEEFGEKSLTERIQPACKFDEPIETDPLLACLAKPATLDELLAQTGFDIADVQNRLFSLQLDGKVRQNFAGTWERVKGL